MSQTQSNLPAWPPLPVRPRLRRPRPRRPVPLWRVAEVARRIVIEVLLGIALGLVAAAAVVGPLAYGMGWL